MNTSRQMFLYLPQEGSGFGWRLGGGMIATQKSRGIWEGEEINLTLGISLIQGRSERGWAHLGWERRESAHLPSQAELGARNPPGCAGKTLRNSSFTRSRRAESGFVSAAPDLCPRCAAAPGWALRSSLGCSSEVRKPVPGRPPCPLLIL